jgi:hypothetical protein
MNQPVEPSASDPRMKRRRFLTLLAGIPILRSVRVRVAGALESDDQTNG